MKNNSSENNLVNMGMLGIRAKFIFSILIALFCAVIAFGLINLKGRTEKTYYTYSKKINIINNQVNNFNKKFIRLTNLSNINRIFDLYSKKNNYNIYLFDISNTLLLKSKNAPHLKNDLFKIVQVQSNIDFSNNSNNSLTFYRILTVNINNAKRFIVITKRMKGSKKLEITQDSRFAFPTAILTFIFIFYILTQRKIKYLKQLSNGLIRISEGNLNYRVDVRSRDELGELARCINYMAEQLEEKIEKERVLENSKNELVANISHDLRTPMTSIIGYIRIIGEGKYNSNNELKSYLNIINTQSNRLKILIDDLFEYTKLSSPNIKINRQSLSLNEMIRQIIEGVESLAGQEQLEIECDLSLDEIIIALDPEKMVRVFDNLLINSISYSKKPGKIKVGLCKSENNAVICISNQCAEIPQEKLDKLFDRFYRADESRNSKFGGSGLGLCIAKSIVELHGGTIKCEYKAPLIYFYVILPLI